MKPPLELPRQEGPGESPLERQLGHLLSFAPAPRLAGQVLRVELTRPRGLVGQGFLDLARDADDDPTTDSPVDGDPARDAAASEEPTASGPGEPVEVRLRAVLSEMGLDAGSVALLSSAATTLAAVRTGRSLAQIAPSTTTRANRPAVGTGDPEGRGARVDEEEHCTNADADADVDVDAGVRGHGAGPGGRGEGGETGVGVPDAGAARQAGQAVLDRIEDLLDLGARLEGALVAATGQLATANAALLLAGKGATDPAELSPTARDRWAARSRSSTAHELSAASGWGIGEARDLVALATAPPVITGPVLAALGSSVVPWRLVRRCWRTAHGAGLDVADTAHLAQVMFGTDPGRVAVERLTPTGTVSTLPWGHRAYHHALDREIAKLTRGDDASARAARAGARAARDATARIDDDGTATVTITATPTQATALIDRLHAAARTARRNGDTRTLAQLRADTATALLLHGTLPLPQTPTDPDQVSVEHITALAAILEGLPAATLNVILPWHLLPGTTDTSSGSGHEHPHRCTTSPCPAAPPPRPTTPPPATATPPGTAPPGAHPPGDGQEMLLAVAQATGTTPAFLNATDIADLALTPGTTLHRLVVDPLDGRCVERSTNAYQPDAHMRAQAIAADGTCRAPGCTRAAIYAQLDHVHEHATGGATTLCNLSCLCTTHHDLKTARHWHATIDAHRNLTWQTLLGRIYATRVRDHRAYTTLLNTAIATVHHATVHHATAATAAAIGQDPRTARAEAIDHAIYTALCHRAPTDPLPTAEEDLTPYDNPYHRPHHDSGRTGHARGDTDQAFTADAATTLTHTDPDGRRRWGPPPTEPDQTTTPCDAPTVGSGGGTPINPLARTRPTQPPAPYTSPRPAHAADDGDDAHGDRDDTHGDHGDHGDAHGNTPWGKRTYGTPPF
ncbi:HNH endonuclease signature motif containing protein [Ornithinimicrobium sp. W1679]|uniref:HNH endonuclease signature motif containing protein n=1 Tax=Ornithinimicrobium sp. W1679 TaxID=3418770 RepID=UPI003CF47B0F